MMREEQGGPTAVFGVRQVKISSTVPETAAHRRSERQQRSVSQNKTRKEKKKKKNIGREINFRLAVKQLIVCVAFCKEPENV